MKMKISSAKYTSLFIGINVTMIDINHNWESILSVESPYMRGVVTLQIPKHIEKSRQFESPFMISISLKNEIEIIKGLSNYRFSKKLLGWYVWLTLCSYQCTCWWPNTVRYLYINSGDRVVVQDVYRLVFEVAMESQWNFVLGKGFITRPQYLSTNKWLPLMAPGSREHECVCVCVSIRRHLSLCVTVYVSPCIYMLAPSPLGMLNVSGIWIMYLWYNNIHNDKYNNINGIT